MNTNGKLQPRACLPTAAAHGDNDDIVRRRLGPSSAEAVVGEIDNVPSRTCQAKASVQAVRPRTAALNERELGGINVGLERVSIRRLERLEVIVASGSASALLSSRAVLIMAQGKPLSRVVQWRPTVATCFSDYCVVADWVMAIDSLKRLAVLATQASFNARSRASRRRKLANVLV